MKSYKEIIQRVYYDKVRHRVDSTWRGFMRIFINARNALVFREYGKRVHWDSGVVFESPYNISVGNRCRIKKGVEIYSDPWGEDKDKITLRIGNNVSINSGTFINAHNYIEIGDGTLIGKNVLLADTRHNFEDPEKPVKENPITLEAPIIIGQGCGIGFNTFIFPGITIGSHSFISANSVVTKDVSPYSVAGGNPAKVIREYDFETKKWVKKHINDGSSENP
ncbi:MAG: acyltransferase [Thermodesulfobacteriota bacterium]|nr:acyltransferase [Thermodesulfobacteriota bacterium]